MSFEEYLVNRRAQGPPPEPTRAICVSLPPQRPPALVTSISQAQVLARQAHEDLMRRASHENEASGWPAHAADDRAIAAVFTDAKDHALAVVGAGAPVAELMSTEVEPFVNLIDLAAADKVFLLTTERYLVDIELGLRDALSEHHRPVELICAEFGSSD